MKNNIDPDHYKKGDVDCIDAIKSSMSDLEFRAYLKGSVMKYLWRYEDKNYLEDLQKCMWFLQKLLNEVENSEK